MSCHQIDEVGLVNCLGLLRPSRRFQTNKHKIRMHQIDEVGLLSQIPHLNEEVGKLESENERLQTEIIEMRDKLNREVEFSISKEQYHKEEVERLRGALEKAKVALEKSSDVFINTTLPDWKSMRDEALSTINQVLGE